MIDLHAHVLPGVDDGPEDFAEAMRMCTMAWESGTEIIIATPHARHETWPNDNRVQLENVKRQLEVELGGRPKLFLGSEIRVDSELLGEIERGIDIIPLADSRYLLLEFPSLNVGMHPEEIVHELHLAGWYPVIAHPERIPWLGGDGELLEELVRCGGLFQITGASVLGQLGRGPRECSRFLMDNEMVSFVASDGHDSSLRPAMIADAYAYVSDIWGEDVARKLMKTNPAQVLASRDLSKDQERIDS